MMGYAALHPSYALKGTVSGAATGMLFGAVGASGISGFSKVLASGTVGGITTEAQGGSFEDGFKMSGMTSLASYGYKAVVGRDPNPSVSNGESAPKDNGINIHPSGNYSEMGLKYTTDQMISGTIPSASENSVFLRGITAVVPFMNALSVFHDKLGGMIESAGYWNDVTNYGTMLPAAAITVAASMNGPLSLMLPIAPIR